MRKMRNKRGGAIAFGAVLALVLVVLGCGFLLFSMFMGGQTETKNAADAGVLNVGRKAIDNVSVDLDSSDQQSVFKDCTSNLTDNNADDTGNANLRNINRIWAKAILMGINADAAPSDEKGSMEGNAQDGFKGAEEISNALADKLNDQNNLHGFFDDYSTANSTRMVGNGSECKNLPGANWQTSLMDRNDESNIVLNGQPPSFNLPPGYNLDSGAYTQTTRTPPPSGANGCYFLKGYNGISVAGNTYWQVPYQFDEKPHLVARSTFDSNKVSASPIDWSKPVPNAFSAEGSTKVGSVGEKAMSWVLTNPREPFQISMPHAFVKIHVDDMVSKWYFFPSGYPPVEFGPELGYGYTTDDKTNVPMPAGGILCSTVTPDSVTLGLDVVGRPLDDIIFGYPDGDSSDVATIENNLTARINELFTVPGAHYSVSDMHSLLSDFKTTGYLIAGFRDFLIYSKDGKTATLLPQDLAVADATWLATTFQNDPDGDDKKVIDDASGLGAIFFSPVVTPDPFCSELLALGWGTYEKDVHWQPGSGYKGNLGVVKVTRWTDVYSLGICNPF